MVKTLCGGKKDILKSMEDREYRRIVMKGYGALLSDFSSKLELLCAMRDYVISKRVQSLTGTRLTFTLQRTAVYAPRQT